MRRSDVLSAWSGIRPLAIDPNAKSTESISRDHVVSEDFPGLITITGGKWTTYRRFKEKPTTHYLTLFFFLCELLLVFCWFLYFQHSRQLFLYFKLLYAIAWLRMQLMRL